MTFSEAQTTSQTMLDELEQHAKGFRKALSAWRKNPNLDTQAKLEAEVIVLKIHAEQTELALEEETALSPEDDVMST
jgi:hypothetical protein